MMTDSGGGLAVRVDLVRPCELSALVLTAVWAILFAGCQGDAGPTPAVEPPLLTLTRTVNLGHAINSMAVSPDGRALYVAISGASPVVVSMRDGSVQKPFPKGVDCSFIHYSPRRDVVFTVSRSGLLCSWGREPLRVLESCEVALGKIRDVKADEPAQVLLIAGMEGMARFSFSPLEGKETIRSTSIQGRVFSVVTDLGIVAVGGVEHVSLLGLEDLCADGSLRLLGLDRDQGRGPVTSAPIGPNAVTAIAYMPWAMSLLVASSTGVELAVIDGSIPPALVPGIHRIVKCMAPFTRSEIVFVSDDVGNIHSVDSGGEARLVLMSAHKYSVTALVASSCESMLISGGRDGKVRFWMLR